MGNEKTGRKINTNLDIVRIIAAFMILAVHTGQNFNRISPHTTVGLKGVQCFLVLSGFLIFKSLENNSDIKQFYIKRIIHIVPIYYIMLVVLYVFDIFYYYFVKNMTFSNIFAGPCSWKFLTYFGFLQAILPSDDYWLWNDRFGLWTMSSFIVFYLIAPLLYKLIKNYYVALVVLCVLLFNQLNFIKFFRYIYRDYPELSHIESFSMQTPLNMMYCFLFGIVLFFAIKEKKEFQYILVLLCTLVFTRFVWNSFEISFTILIAAAVLLQPMVTNSRLISIIRFLSNGSFALYLCHPVIIKGVVAISEKFGFSSYIKLVLILVTTIVGSYLIWLFIQKPVEDYLSKKSMKRAT